MLEFGTVVEVSEELAGSTLVADAVLGATSLLVADASDFDERGGQLAINAEVLTYVAVDMVADTVTLDAVTPLGAAAVEGDAVTIYPDAPVRSALVELEYVGDAVLVRVPHHLASMLPLGIREPDMQESVTIDRSSAAWVIQDVVGRPAVVQGEAVDVSTLDPVENISVDYTYPGDITMTQVQGGLIASVFETPDVGSGKMRLSDIFGLQSLRADGSARFDLPNSDDRSISFDGEIVTNRFTSTDEFALRGVNNEIAKDAVVTLQRGTTQPVTPPGVSIGWDFTAVEDALNLNGFWYGLTRIGTDWFRNLAIRPSPTVSGGKVEKFDDTGDMTAGFNVGVDAVGGITAIGTTLYVLGSRTAANFTKTWWVERYDTSGTKLSEWQWNLPGSPATTFRPGIGTDGTNIMVAQCLDSGQVYWKKYNPTTGAQVGSTVLGETTAGYHVGSVVEGSFDFGATRTVVTYAGAPVSVRVFSVSGTTATYQSAQGFVAADGATIAGIDWDGSNFRSLSRGNANLYTYTAITNTSSPWWVGNTWRRADATGPDFAQYETKLGNPRKFTMTRRANVIVNTAPIPVGAGGPDAADSMTLYFGTGASQPTNSNFFRRATPAAGVESVQFTTMDFTGGNPPTSGNFPDANPAKIASDDPALLSIDGNGTIVAPKKMQCGSVTVNVTASADGTPVAVVFPVPFASAPIVTAQASGTFSYTPYIQGVTATGMNVAVTHKNSTSATTTVNVYWIAMVP